MDPVDVSGGLFWLFCIVVMPFFVSAEICKTRNRDIIKGLLITLCFGWFGTIGLWLALKTRNFHTQTLY